MTAPHQLQQLLGLRRSPVAVIFRASAPAGVPHVASAGPSSCSYWKLAADGRAFYTEASDHHNCPIGAYTHGVDLTEQVKADLQGVVTTMIGLGYIRGEEVPGIPRREASFGVAVYAPLSQSDGEPDVVIVAGNARQMMLLAEAAGAAGLMGRPTCAALPQAVKTGQGVLSLGCIGNRVYTGLSDDEAYFALPGGQVKAVTEKLAGIVRANGELEKYHSQKRAAISGQ
jgi:uncharacterized protein (DUF169 family)